MNRRVSTLDADALLDGRAPRAADLEPVAALLDDLRVEYGATPPPAPRPALVARLDGHAPLHAVPDPLAPVDAPARGRARRGLRPAAAVAVAGAVVFGGLASAGALPGPLQRASADLAEKIGIDLPASGTGDDAPTPPASARVDASVGTRPDGTTGADADADARVQQPSAPEAPAAATPPSTTLPTVPPETELPLPLPSLPVPVPDATTPTSQLPPPSLPLDQDDVREILREVPELLRRR
jgi:hypothetical protein